MPAAECALQQNGWVPHISRCKGLDSVSHYPGIRSNFIPEFSPLMRLKSKLSVPNSVPLAFYSISSMYFRATHWIIDDSSSCQSLPRLPPTCWRECTLHPQGPTWLPFSHLRLESIGIGRFSEAWQESLIVTLQMMSFPKQGHIVADLQSKLCVKQEMHCGISCRVTSPLVNSYGTPRTSLGVSYHRPSARWYRDLVKLGKGALGRMLLSQRWLRPQTDL